MRIAALLLSAVLAGAQDYSLDKDGALTRQLAADFLRSAKLLENDDVAAYVRSVGTRLVNRMEQQPSYTYPFTVTAEWQEPPPLEAYGFPDGHVVVPSNLILGAQDEAELAGALAHAIIHIGVRRAIRTSTQAGQLGSVPLVYFGAVGRPQSTPLLLPAGFLQFQRANESETDLMAVRLISDAGYNPEGLARYISRVQVDATRPELASAPSREERLEAIRKAINNFPERTYSSSDDLASIQELVRLEFVRRQSTNDRPPHLTR